MPLKPVSWQSVMYAKVGIVHRFEKSVREAGLKQGIVSLSFHRLFMQIGLGLFGIFAAIYFLHVYHDHVSWLICGVIAQYTINFFLTPYGARWMTRLGMPVCLMLGTIFLGLYHFVLTIRSYIPFWSFFILTLALVCLYHAIYWVPYHVEFVQATSLRKRGQILGYLSAMGSFIAVVTPIAAGYIITYWGYPILTGVAFLCILSSLPFLTRIKAARERYVYSYLQSFRVLFSRPYRMFLFVYMAEGAENIVGAVLWPVFLFQISQGNYIRVGISSGIIVAATIVLEVIVGYFSNQYKNTRLLKTGIGLSSFGWIVKAFVTTLTQAALAGIYHSFALILMRTPYQVRMYALAADAGHYIDEYTVLREMALDLGRIVMLLACLVGIAYFGFVSGFVLAAFTTIAFGSIIRLPFEKHAIVSSLKPSHVS